MLENFILKAWVTNTEVSGGFHGPSAKTQTSTVPHKKVTYTQSFFARLIIVNVSSRLYQNMQAH